MRDELFFRRVRLLKLLGLLALFGVAILMAAILFSDAEPPMWAVFSILFVMPGLVYLVLVVIWHWKSRYIGNHSDLWGGLILIETSGWSKLVYLFRHIIPDARGTGRYARDVRPVA